MTDRERWHAARVSGRDRLVWDLQYSGFHLEYEDEIKEGDLVFIAGGPIAGVEPHWVPADENAIGQQVGVRQTYARAAINTVFRPLGVYARQNRKTVHVLPLEGTPQGYDFGPALIPFEGHMRFKLKEVSERTSAKGRPCADCLFVLDEPDLPALELRFTGPLAGTLMDKRPASQKMLEMLVSTGRAQPSLAKYNNDAGVPISEVRSSIGLHVYAIVEAEEYEGWQFSNVKTFVTRERYDRARGVHCHRKPIPAPKRAPIGVVQEHVTASGRTTSVPVLSEKGEPLRADTNGRIAVSEASGQHEHDHDHDHTPVAPRLRRRLRSFEIPRAGDQAWDFDNKKWVEITKDHTKPIDDSIINGRYPFVVVRAVLMQSKDRRFLDMNEPHQKGDEIFRSDTYRGNEDWFVGAIPEGTPCVTPDHWRRRWDRVAAHNEILLATGIESGDLYDQVTDAPPPEPKREPEFSIQVQDIIAEDV